MVLDKITESVRNGGKRITATEAKIAAGYSESYAKSGHMAETEAWGKLLEAELPDSLLTKVHKEGLAATKLQDKEIVEDYGVRHHYLDSAYKLKKRYDNTLTVKKGISELSDTELEEIAAGAVSDAIEGLAGAGEEEASSSS